ncbi:hypothetical protein BBAD15_g6393 [Beauveria bassiana D1-5]|uniref:Uncharacterized protein n=1 Tax=Beauveria bassiana D1-5 TaxID=1245745 RepID=A0A0A2W5N6_BEABA|nr:hypothetical protein BBAD15_g6393 [Beauveria bassiana D1-5]
MCLCFRRRRPSFRYRQLPSAETLLESARPSPVRLASSRPHTTWASPPPPLPAQPPPPRHPAVAAGFAETTPTSPFSQQRERLILELFPFKDAGKFHEWLRGGPVQGSWREFQRDLLARLPADGDRPDPGPDKARMAQATKDAINARSQKFLVYHPDKSGWSPEDHHVRFMTTVIMDSLLANLWSDSDWKKKNLDIYKAVYEVLFFLKASHYMNQQAPPSYSD